MQAIIMRYTILPLLLTSFLLPGCQSGPTPIATKAADASYSTTVERDGFATQLEDGRLWVFAADSEALAEFRKHGEPAKCTTLIGAGPGGMTLKGPDRETLDAYLGTRPGFAARVEDGRLWVFRAGSSELADYDANGAPALCATVIGIGPGGMTVKSPDRQTIQDWQDS
jgi:hypothetical protein